MQQVGSETFQRLCVAALIGQMEAIISTGALSEPLEKSCRLLVAQTLAAYRMKSKAELELAKIEQEKV